MNWRAALGVGLATAAMLGLMVSVTPPVLGRLTVIENVIAGVSIVVISICVGLFGGYIFPKQQHTAKRGETS